MFNARKVFGLLLACSILFGLTAFSVAASETNSIIVSDVEQIAAGFAFTEGPVWHKSGYLLFSDIPPNKIYKWSAKQGAEIWRDDSGNSNGLTFDPKGNFIACEHGNRRVSISKADGSILAIADKWEGKRFNSPNDCVVRSDRMIFFTDPDYGLKDKSQRDIPFNGVYRVMPGEGPVLLVKDFNKPNGIALSPDEKLLYIADTANSHVRVFNVAKDGTLSNDKVFTEVPHPDGIKVDMVGNLYATAKTGVEVFNPSGKLITTITVPENPANCGFGGRDNKTLFITARRGLYKVKLKNAGVPVWK